MSWINIFLCNTSCGCFNAVTVVNDHISEQYTNLICWRQGDPIAGHMFVICIEVLVILRKKSKAKPYTTRDGVPVLNDTHTDDLTVYLEDNDMIKTSIQIMSRSSCEPPLVNALQLKWSRSFELSGINFDRTLDQMHLHFLKDSRTFGRSPTIVC